MTRPIPPLSSVTFRGKKLFGWIVFIFLLLLSIGVGAVAGLIVVYTSDLPQVRALEDYRPDVITELYADDGQVIGSFALERRVVVTYEQIPPVLKDAIISVEDQNFERHIGIDLRRILSAAYRDLIAWRKKEGASTLTQQLSRNLFLSPDKSFKRKFQEILLAIQIERQYTKPQIMTMYCNQIYLGHGVYGFAAGAQFFFSKSLAALTLEEAALLAGLPQRPNANSPLLNPRQAWTRRNHVLERMVAEKKISRAQAESAKRTSVVLNVSQPRNDLAPYFVEEIRKYLEDKYGTEAVHSRGLKVYTTLNVEMQRAANEAVATGLRAYDKRHGWRGVQQNIFRNRLGTLEKFEHEDWKKPIVPGAVLTGLILNVNAQEALVRIGKDLARVTAADLAWTGRASPAQIFSRGDLALFLIEETRESSRPLKVSLVQRPLVQGALAAIEPVSGEVKAMVGGYDFEESKFNRATQALRQVGSSFKPYVYAAAMESGMKPEDTILDAPVSFPGGSGIYAPHNYDYKYEGVITLRRALAQSRNVPAVKIAAQVGIPKVIDVARRFGITSKLDPYLPLALGSADVTLIEQTSAFSTFPNDGVRALPHLIRRVTDQYGEIFEENLVEVKEAISSATARTMVAMMREVVEHGTATRAKILKRPVAGKTGTTNDFTDAWFIGYTPSLCVGVWVGFDEKKTLGKGETGAKAALPIWLQFMEAIYKDKPVETFFADTPSSMLMATAPPAEKVDTADDAAGDGESPPAGTPEGSPPPAKPTPHAPAKKRAA